MRIEESAYIGACDLQPALTFDGTEQPEDVQQWREMDGVICEVEVLRVFDADMIARASRHRAQDRRAGLP